MLGSILNADKRGWVKGKCGGGDDRSFKRDAMARVSLGAMFSFS